MRQTGDLSHPHESLQVWLWLVIDDYGIYGTKIICRETSTSYLYMDNHFKL